MGLDGPKDILVAAVGHAKFPGGIPNDPGQGRVMGMANPRTDMMDHMQIEPAHIPGKQPILQAKI